MTIRLQLSPLDLEEITPGAPLIISGPCSAESEPQMLNTAEKLARQNIKIFRAGIWKPRTRPNSFEGCGTPALAWMQKVKAATGMYTATEVANSTHVKKALDHGIDILWIGARTTANPFAVQEIADALAGSDLPVMVKNPVNPDIELWIGALERLNNAGITRLLAIHRGFSHYEKGLYRNPPNWQIPIELKRRIPELPVITDPSHICGNREGLLEISQKTLDLAFDGLMIESHINPEEALSDRQQQVTPDELKILLNNLVFRHALVDEEGRQSLENLRIEIDKYDHEIISLLENRMQIVEKIAFFKKENNITIFQAQRWNEILTTRIAEGTAKGLDEDFLSKIFSNIHQESINHQEKIMNELSHLSSEIKRIT